MTDRDLRVALIGNVDSGKSSLTGVLTRGVLDDGRGLARSFVLRHDHERAKGQTSSVGMELLGFDDDGRHVVPTALSSAARTHERRLKEYREVSRRSTRKVVLIDLCGHAKYLKTTLTGLCGFKPDQAVVLVAANHGAVPKMTLEHTNMAFVLGLPIAFVVTKIDMAPPDQLEKTLLAVENVRQRLAKRRVARGDAGGDAPVFQVSNKTGEGIEELKAYILKTSVELEARDAETADALEAAPLDYTIESSYQVPGVGVVVGGYLTAGKELRVGQVLYLGPNRLGAFDKVVAKSLHRQCLPVEAVFQRQQSTVAIKFVDLKKRVDKTYVRKGARLVQDDPLAAAATAARARADSAVCQEFEADVRILKHSTTIREGYSSILHVGNVRQTATIVKIYAANPDLSENVAKLRMRAAAEDAAKPVDHSPVLRMGSTGRIRFKFQKNPELLRLNQKLIFREGSCRGVGTIVGFEE